MLTNIFLLLLPKWKSLSKDNRKELWHTFIHPLITYWPIEIIKFIFLGILLILIIKIIPDGWTLYFGIFLAIFIGTDLIEIAIIQFNIKELYDKINNIKK
ncbi:hypothetical protein LBMAG53_21870 [Planctomycetota bacterium]|nr:hypothetical protein LBMAG53_21870 [Planctomycetota bacterium]